MEKDRYKNPRAQALSDKAWEIVELVDSLLKAAPEGAKRAEMLKVEIDHMYADARILPVKIAGAEAGGLYDLRMECASIMRKAANDLILGLRGLEMFGYDEPGYFNLLRAEVEEFRKLFVAWVQGFDHTKYMVDRWGVFNPPGVGPDDEDPEWPFGGDEDDED